MALFTGFCGFFVYWLQGYHYYLLFRNETTNENLKGSYELLGNPFNRGFVDNVRRLFSRDKRNWHPEDKVEMVKREIRPKRNQNVRQLYKVSMTSQSQISTKQNVRGNEDTSFKHGFRVNTQG